MNKLIPTKMKNLNNKRPLFAFLIILLMTVGLTSCYKKRLEIDKIAGGTWNPNVAAPLVYANLDMNRLIKDSKNIWKEDPDGLLSLIYREEAVSEIADKVIEFPNQQNDTIINFQLPPNMQVGDSAFRYIIFDTEFETANNEKLDSILIKSGVATFDIVSDMNHDGYIEVTIPSMTKYGVTFRERIEYIYSGGATTAITVTVPLQDYYLVLDNSGGKHNNVKEFVKVSGIKSSNPDNSPYTFELTQKLEDITYHLAMGYFHIHTFSVDETTIPINLFDNQTANSIFMSDPHMYITLRNTYGLPSEITFTELYAERDGVKKDITSTLLPTLNVNYPDFSNIGGYDTTIYHFNVNNSNILDVIELNPTQLVFEGSVTTNPTGTMVPNFVLDTSHITVDVELEIPLYGRALDFELQDTSDINSGDGNSYDGLKSLALNVNTENGFPVDVTLQIYMADSLNNVIDSMFHEPSGYILKAAPIGPAPEYKVTANQHNLAKVPLNNDQIENFKKSKRLITSAKATTLDAGQKIVKIYSDYSVFIEVAAKAEYETDF